MGGLTHKEYVDVHISFRDILHERIIISLSLSTH